MPAKAKLTTRERTTSNVAADNLNKGSELSFAEADSNFFNLRDQSFAISDGTTSTDIEAGETITFSGASVSGNTVTITGGGGSADLGNLQVNNTTLEPITTNNNLILNANGTGTVKIEGATFETDPSTSPAFTGTGISAGSNASRIEFHDNGTLYHRAGSAFNALSSSGNDLNLYTTAKVRAINATGIVVGNTNIDVEIESRSGGSLTLKTGEGDNPDVSGFIKIQDGADQDITITPNGTGKIILDGLNWPTADGTNGQVLKTDGAGNLSFATGTQGNITISDFNTATIIDTGDYAAAQTENDTTILTSGATQDAIERQKLLVYAGNTSPGNTILSVDRDTASIVRDTLDTNITVGSIQNFEAGQSIVFIFTQDGTGNRTVTWTDTIKWLGGSSTLSTGANKVDKVTLINDGQVILGELNKDYS